MLRRSLLILSIAMLFASTRGCCWMFRGLGEAIGKAMAAQSTLPFRQTIRLFPLADPCGLPGMAPFIAVSQEPAPDVIASGYTPSPSWLTLIEFGPVIRGQSTGPGVKIQIPFPVTAMRRIGPITLMDGAVRLLAPAWGPEWARGVTLARTVPDRSWEDAFKRTDGWTGADGAATIPLPGGRALWLFGDSFIGPVINGKHAAGTAMVNNTIAVCIAAPLPSWPGQPAFLWGPRDAKGAPTAWAIPAGTGQGAEWFWPAGGGIVAPDAAGHDRLYIFLCRLGRKDASDSIWNFEARGTTLVVVENPSDEPDRWRRRQADLCPLLDAKGRKVTWGAAVLPAQGHQSDLLILGIDSTAVLDKKVLLARAAAATIGQFDSWSFWDGRAFTPGPEHAAPVVSSLASELSLHRLTIAGRERLVMIYSELTLGPRILCRTADQPEGPWSEPTTLYDCPEPIADKKLMVYAAKAHPELSRPGELLISYCVNSTDFWDALAHAEKYRPRFIRVPLALLPPSPSSASSAPPR